MKKEVDCSVLAEQSTSKSYYQRITLS